MSRKFENIASVILALAGLATVLFMLYMCEGKNISSRLGCSSFPDVGAQMASLTPVTANPLTTQPKQSCYQK
jgi:hypothetical protein